MENMDKGFTAEKSAEDTQNAPNFICPSPKVWDFDEKRLHWGRASVVPDFIKQFIQQL